jgi:hypothetical protein
MAVAGEEEESSESGDLGQQKSCRIASTEFGRISQEHLGWIWLKINCCTDAAILIASSDYLRKASGLILPPLPWYGYTCGDTIFSTQETLYQHADGDDQSTPRIKKYISPSLVLCINELLFHPVTIAESLSSLVIDERRTSSVHARAADAPFL